MGCGSSSQGAGGKKKVSKEEIERRNANKKKGKRGSISAERVDKGALDSYKKPVYPKDSDSSMWISNCLQTNNKMQLLFGHLSEYGLQDVVNAFKEVRPPRDQDVIRQGDDGDCLYILYEGSVDVYVSPEEKGKPAPETKGARVASLHPGSLFGELALMYSSPRSATVTVTQHNTRLWALDREPFKMLLAKSARDTLNQLDSWLRRVDIFQVLTQEQMNTLQDALTRKVVEPGVSIIRQGEVGDSFYLLEEGSAAAYITGPDGEKEVHKYSQVGSYFGELALLKDEPRKATVRAIGQGATVWVLNKEDFESLLGPLGDAMQKNTEKYSQYHNVAQSASVCKAT